MRGTEDGPFFTWALHNAHWLLLACAILATGASFQKYAGAEDFRMLLESPCDSLISECYVRDCGGEDECPPNNLSVYSVHSLPASHFSKCEDNFCKNLCDGSDSDCFAVRCSDQSDIACVGPLSHT